MWGGGLNTEEEGMGQEGQLSFSMFHRFSLKYYSTF